ncbi:MAG: radical SAM protein, partial [Clostridia bacterium]|nr:radical SAM protein [Clostridia bacterium]
MKVSFVTLGCRVNHYESEALREKLGALGIGTAARGETPDICVVNTCAVTEESVRKSRQAVRRAVKTCPGGMVCVMGCASQLEPDTFSGIGGVSFVCGTRNRNEAYEAIRRFSETGAPLALTVIVPPGGGVEPMRISGFDRTRAYVKIEDGCNGKCSYCVIKDVRGAAAVRDRDDILSEVRGLAAAGCREVVLTGIETAAYGRGLPDLIDGVSLIDGIERIRLGSMEPSFMTRSFIDRVAENGRFCPHFHVSIQ